MRVFWFFLLFFLFSSYLHSETDGPKKTWTVLIYMAADNDLEAAALDDLSELESLGSTQYLNLVVQADRAEQDGNWNPLDPNGYTSGDGDWKDCRRFYIEKGAKKLIKNVGEQDMSDPETLEDFIRWGTSAYPADRLILVMWNHGDGILGVNFKSIIDVDNKDIGYDNTGHSMSITEMREAIENTGVHFDVIGFDACLMNNIEVAYELSEVADYVLGSEENVPGPGYPYKKMLNILRDNPSCSVRAFLKHTVNAYVDHYKYHPQYWLIRQQVTMSAIDSKGFAAVIPQFNSFAKKIAQSKDEAERFKQALSKVQRFSLEEYIDLIDLLEKYPSVGTGNLTQLIKQELIVHERHSGSEVKNANGLSVYVSNMIPDLAYEQTRFGRDTWWLSALMNKTSFDSFYMERLSQMKNLAGAVLTDPTQADLSLFAECEEKAFRMAGAWIVRMQCYTKIRSYCVFMETIPEENKPAFKNLTSRLVSYLRQLSAANSDNPDFNKELMESRLSELEQLL